MAVVKSSSSGLSCTEIISIIETCHNNNVSSFKLADMSIEFDLHLRERDNVKVERVLYQDLEAPTSMSNYDDIDGDQADLVDAFLDSEDLLEQLKLTDPYEWERLTIKDEVENG